ncbi:MAG: zinc-binding dehydrogenase [Pirellulaceae bacterium]|nr:zinc-binding dehydrogenase [Pirellulaceae bacterium]
MLAGEIYAPQKIRLVDTEEPALAGDSIGEILFQPELACLCGSDLTYFQNSYEEFPPRIGQSLHEMIGRVVQTSGAKFCEGDRVLCVPVEHFGLWERFRVTENNAILVDPRPSDVEAVMAQPLATVLFALKKIPQVFDADVAVVGQGPMGQLFNAVLRNLGARRIIAIDLDPTRLEVSSQMGANHTVDAGANDPVDAVAQITGGAMCDLVVEAVGHREQVLNLCSDLCRKAGDLLFFGVPPAVVDGIELKKLFWKNIAIYTSVGPSFERDFPLAMRWIAERRVDVNPIVTHHFALDEIQIAFDTFFQHRDGALKVFVEFPK